MAKYNRKKKKKKPDDRSQRMNHLKARALATVAQKAWDGRRSHLSVALLTDAVRREPENVKLIVDLARVHGLRRDYESAEKLLTRASKLASRKAAFQRLIGQTYANIDRPLQAVECYRRALELNEDAPTTTQTLVELAQLYERGHQLEEAYETIQRALARDPGHEEARLRQALLSRRTGDLEEAESRLRSMLGSTLQSTPVHVQAWYELAQLLDKLSRFEEAFDAFSQAKQLLCKDRGPFVKACELTLTKNQELLGQLTNEHYDKWSELARDDEPFRCAVLTGHPRSGTTLVEQVLDSHNELISADEFDVMNEWIFSPLSMRFPPNTAVLKVLDQVPSSVRQEARRTYWERSEAIFAEPIGSRILLDKNPAMTFNLPMINWAFPEMKLLIALRDPRDVVLSCFMQKLPMNPHSVNWLSLEGAARYYARIMGAWLAVREVTTSKWIEFQYEASVADLEKQAKRLLEFLGLPWDEKVLKFHEHAREKRVRSPTYEAVTNPIYHGAVGRWHNYAKHLEPVRDILEPFVKEFGY